MQRRDLGEIITGYRYLREVYPAGKNEKGRYLLSSEDLFLKLKIIYDTLCIEPMEDDRIDVKIKLPDSPNYRLRTSWQETVVKKSNQPLLVKVDSLTGRIESEVILGTKLWMREFEAEQGDRVVISPSIPASGFNFRLR